MEVWGLVGIGAGGGVLAIGYGVACYHWGRWRARARQLAEAAELSQRVAAALAEEAPRGADLLERL